MALQVPLKKGEKRAWPLKRRGKETFLGNSTGKKGQQNCLFLEMKKQNRFVFCLLEIPTARQKLAQSSRMNAMKSSQAENEANFSSFFDSFLLRNKQTLSFSLSLWETSRRPSPPCGMRR